MGITGGRLVKLQMEPGKANSLRILRMIRPTLTVCKTPLKPEVTN
jgi:hypothetical protein